MTATVTRGVSDRRVPKQQKTPRDLWASFWAQTAGEEPVHAFDVYVARLLEGKAPFRTLIWCASLEPARNVAELAGECFRLAFQSTRSRLESQKEKSFFESVIFTRRRAEAETKADRLVLNSGFGSSTTVADVDFLRIDRRAPEGMVSFSCRSLSKESEFELTVLMEQEFSFSGRLLNWVLSQHQLATLRDDPEAVDLHVLKGFLNDFWKA